MLAAAPFALVCGAIAAGGDLSGAPQTVSDEWWHVAAVVAVVVLYGGLGTLRLGTRALRRRERRAAAGR